MNKLITLSFILSAAMFSACDNASSNENNFNPSAIATQNNVSGIFVDSAVEGLLYKCNPSKLTGTTNYQGEFTCKEEDDITFYIGDILVGGAIVQEKISPYTLFEDNITSVINLTRLLQTLDNDSNPNNGIILREYRTQLLNNEAIIFSSKNFEFNLESLLGNKLVDVKDAMKHLHSTLEMPTDTIDVLVKDYISTNYQNSFSSSSSSSLDNIDSSSKTGAELFSKCAACHGQNGEKNALGKSDIIGGRDVNVLTAQLNQYKLGTLNSHGMGALMKGQVAQYTSQDIATVSEYISLLTLSQTSSSSSSSSSLNFSSSSLSIDDISLTQGAALFKKCEACHDADGMKNPLGKPLTIGGRDINELIEILKLYKVGARNNHEMGGLMKGQVLGYSTSEINAVAGYISTLK